MLCSLTWFSPTYSGVGKRQGHLEEWALRHPQLAPNLPCIPCAEKAQLPWLIFLADLCLCLHLHTDVGFLFSSLKQTNGCDGELYGSQPSSRRSGRVSIANLRGTAFTRAA